MYYLKYKPRDLETWIEELKSLKLSKEMIIVNTEKYGYMKYINYILWQL